MTNWLPELAPGRPRYLAIAEAMRNDVQRGVLKPGERLPTHRDLAWSLKITTGTVTRAYAEAEKMGLLVGEVGRGSFVTASSSEPLPLSAEQNSSGIIDLSQAMPPAVHDTQDLDEALGHIMQQTSRLDLLEYTPAQGHPMHRDMGALWLGRSGIAVAADQVVVTSGAQSGLIAVLAALGQAGGKLLAAGLNYPALRSITRQCGLGLVAVAADAAGLLPEAVEQQARASGARLVYVVPSLHNPTTATLPAERRQRLVEIARRLDLTLIEDDIFRLLDPAAQPDTLFALAPERTWHVTSISKTLAPGLRIGFVATPPGKAETVMRHQTVTAGRPVGLAAEIARQWIMSATASRVLAAIIAENRQRRNLTLAALSGRNVVCREGSCFLWLPLPPQWSEARFVHAALAQGVQLVPGNAFAITGDVPSHAVRLCFGGPSSRAQLQTALSRVNALLDAAPAEAFTTVA